MELNMIIEEFIKLYGGDKSDLRVFSSPGRVNMIGEHTDYNGGFVFPAALTMNTTIVVRKRNDNVIRLKATDLDVMVAVSVNAHLCHTERSLQFSCATAGVLGISTDYRLQLCSDATFHNFTACFQY